MLAANLLFYYPFRGSWDSIYRYWDGPHYYYLAKTLYQVPGNHPFTAYGLPRSYFASHLPAYPVLIRLCRLLAPGYPQAMVLATTASAVVSAVLFHRLLETARLVRSPLWTTLLFAVLPPRWLIYHSVGATEPLFLCFVFAALLAVRDQRPGRAALFGMLASLTRITGVLLVVALVAVALGRRRWREALVLSSAGLGVLGLFAFYHIVLGDFWAYFRWNLQTSHLVRGAPFAVYRAYAAGDNFQSTEYLALTYLGYGLGTLLLWKHREIFAYCAVMFAFNAFVFHVDLARYFLAIAPFAILVGFDGVLSTRAFRLLAPLAAYLTYVYAWSFVRHNLVVEFVYHELLRQLR